MDNFRCIVLDIDSKNQNMRDIDYLSFQSMLHMLMNIVGKCWQLRKILMGMMLSTVLDED
jgi:hypothetical protein